MTNGKQEIKEDGTQHSYDTIPASKSKKRPFAPPRMRILALGW